ncbi:MAG: winged helix-turn-helix transcriptional regulator [Thermoplasmata archaeon]
MKRPPRDREFAREVACMIQIDGAQYCLDPAGGLVEVLGKRWTLPLIGVLGNRARSRFSELRDALPGIGSKSLTERLRDLDRLGLVHREVFPEVPLRTEYRLTDAGASLRRALVPLVRWAGSAPPSPPAPAAVKETPRRSTGSPDPRRSRKSP